MLSSTVQRSGSIHLRCLALFVSLLLSLLSTFCSSRKSTSSSKQSLHIDLYCAKTKLAVFACCSSIILFSRSVISRKICVLEITNSNFRFVHAALFARGFRGRIIQS